MQKIGEGLELPPFGMNINENSIVVKFGHPAKKMLFLSITGKTGKYVFKLAHYPKMTIPP